jgi:2-dehydro-3-deoxyphosphogluconate aldolase/(4S)-4-hydroxy-2-oxoglutarate aldolase
MEQLRGLTNQEKQDLIAKIGIIPVMTIHEPEKAPDAARALLRGGLAAAEVTLRTGAALESIRRIAAECPAALIGAGTVITASQVDDAARAGALFIVSPGLNPRVAERGLERGLMVVPGCLTPSDIEAALGLGISTVKLFPAEQAGGTAYINALAGPFGQVRFIPTGGITQENIGAYLRLKPVLACGGSWIASANRVRSGDFAGITRAAKAAVLASLSPSFAGAFLRAKGPANRGPLPAGGLLSALFSCPQGNTGRSGEEYREDVLYVEVASLERALFHLASQGLAFNPQMIKRDDQGNLLSLYAQDVFEGAALCFIERP